MMVERDTSSSGLATFTSLVGSCNLSSGAMVSLKFSSKRSSEFSGDLSRVFVSIMATIRTTIRSAIRVNKLFFLLLFGAIVSIIRSSRLWSFIRGNTPNIILK